MKRESLIKSKLREISTLTGQVGRRTRKTKMCPDIERKQVQLSLYVQFHSLLSGRTIKQCQIRQSLNSHPWICQLVVTCNFSEGCFQWSDGDKNHVVKISEMQMRSGFWCNPLLFKKYCLRKFVNRRRGVRVEMFICLKSGFRKCLQKREN